MADPTYITKSNAEYTSMNYEELRKLGLAKVQELSPDTWTDHNAHDPGITILELLSYAISDIGHRTNYSVRDILSEKYDSLAPIAQANYGIEKILPCNPVTINDWRKLLIDIPQIRNAWMKTTSPETPEIFNHFPEGSDNNEGTLTFTATAPEDFESTPIHIKGLYEVYLDLHEHSVFGDLQATEIPWQIRLLIEEGGEEGEDVIEDIDVVFDFPAWDTLDKIWYEQVWESQAFEMVNFNYQAATGEFSCLLNFDINEGFVNEINISGTTAFDLSSTAVEDAVNAALTDTSDDGIIDYYHQKVITINGILNDVKKYLLDHRNLCEDFLSVNFVCFEDIILKGDIIVKQGADADKISGIVYFLIAEFLRPLIRFRTLEEMKELGYTIEQAFSGPLLEGGFIHDDDFEGPLLENEYLLDKRIRCLVRNAFGTSQEEEVIIYTSDLIRIIMCLKKELGIIAVRNFRIINNETEARDCLTIYNAYRCKPKLHVEKSINSLLIKTESLTTLGEDEVLAVDTDNVLSIMKELAEAYDQDLTSEELVENQAGITPEKGTAKNIENYYSLQNDFPLTYGIGKAGLPPTVTTKRYAQAKQLKAYLLFFEQFLANYQSQLAHVKELFSIDRRVKQTYFTQSLYNVPDAYLLLKDFVDSHQSDINSYNLVAGDWVLYKEDLENFYMTQIQEWAEEPALYLDRRNRFLDHLLARFGEDANDYSALGYFVNQDNIQEELIKCKISFLEKIPLISRDRGRAFNHCKRTSSGLPAAWTAYLQSGYRTRLTELLGLKGSAEIYPETDSDGIDEFRFRIRNTGGQILLSGSQNYLTNELDLLNEHIGKVTALATDINNYELLTTINGRFYFNLVDLEGDVLARRIQYFDTELERSNAIDEVIATINGEERVHYIEHLLLRPQSDTDFLLQTKDVNLTAIQDPYSFGSSVIFPAFMAPFNDSLFRSYAERIVYMETPAHILPEVYWVDDLGAFNKFESLYKVWLTKRAEVPPIDEIEYNVWINDIQLAHVDLVNALDGIRTEA